jgi:hypothetical protein
MARTSSFRVSIPPATAVISPKSVFSEPLAGVVIAFPSQYLCCDV